MADLIPPMLIKLQADVSELKVGLAQAESAIKGVDNSVKNASTGMSKFAANLKNMAGGFVGLYSLQKVFTSTIADVGAYEAAIAKAGAIIQSTGNVAGVSVEHFKAQASALENLTSVDENLILQSQNVMATFTQIRNVVGAGNDIFDQATKTALDLSVVMGGDLQGATVQLGKALSDPIKGITALTRVGVTFDDQQKAAIKTLMEHNDVMGAQKIILAEVNREFGGAGKAVGDTFAGGVARAKDKVTDFTRDLAIGLEPILLSIGKTIGDLINTYIKPFVNLIIKNKEAVLLFVGVLGAAFAAFKAYQVVMAATTAIQELYIVGMALAKGAKLADIAATEGQTGAMVLLNAVMNANPIAKVVVVLAALSAAFVVAWNHSDAFRKVVVQGLQIVINAFGYLIGAVGKLLEAMSHIPGIGGKFKGVSTAVNNAANDVRKFSDGLDGLANKKIALPSFGGAKSSTDTSGGANAPVTGPLKGQIKAQQDAIKKLAGYQKDVEKIYKEMNSAIADAQEKADKALVDRNDKMIAVQKDYDKKVIDLNAKYADVVEKAQKVRTDKEDAIKAAYDKKTIDLEKKLRSDLADIQAKANVKSADLTKAAAEKQISIIQQSMDILRNAFASKTVFSIADAFGGGGKASDAISALKKSLAAAKELQGNAATLAGMGYSQTFIAEVVKQGPEAGNKIAQALKEASPEATKELQGLYTDIVNTSDHGLDALAKSMNAGGKLATQELMDAYAQVAVDLKASLATVDTELQKSLADANLAYSEAMTEAKITRDEGLADALKAFTEAKAEAQKNLDDGLAEAQKTLQDALLAAQKDYEAAIDEINKATQAKLEDLKAKLLEVAALMKSISAASAAAAVSNAPTYTPIIPTTTPSATTSTTPTTTTNITQTFNTAKVDPSDVHLAVISATKYGQAVTIPQSATAAIKTGTSGGYVTPVSFSVGSRDR